MKQLRKKNKKKRRNVEENVIPFWGCNDVLRLYTDVIMCSAVLRHTIKLNKHSVHKRKKLPLTFLKFILERLISCKHFKRYFTRISCLQIYANLQSFIELSLLLTNLLY